MTKTAKKEQQVKEVKVTKETKKVKKAQKATQKQEIKKVESKSTIDKKLVVKLFNKGLTPYQIAKQIGKYYSQVAPILEKEGLTWEKRSNEPSNKRTRSIYCDDEQYAKIQELLKK